MQRNRFRLTLKNLYFCVNNSIDPNNKCAKVWPVLDMIQQRCQKFGILTIALSVDESMIPYYEKYWQKFQQRMLLKPITSGYKVWCHNLKGVYLYNFETCQGKGSKNEFSNHFGLGPSVVLGLLKSLPPRSFNVLIINYFNLISPLKHLKTKEIAK